MKVAELHVHTANEDAVEWYTKQGFKVGYSTDAGCLQHIRSRRMVVYVLHRLWWPSDLASLHAARWVWLQEEEARLEWVKDTGTWAVWSEHN